MYCEGEWHPTNTLATASTQPDKTRWPVRDIDAKGARPMDGRGASARRQTHRLLGKIPLKSESE